MIDFAPAKINLGLQITARRADGYHLLETLFVPISLCDILEITPSHSGEDSLRVLGDIATGATADNLVLRAVRLLRSHYDFPAVEITLKKQIPSGAGLGGGSSDATATLKMLRGLFQLPATDEELCRLALSLGADCPFFVCSTPAIAEGVGEVLRPAPAIDFSPYRLLVAKPEVHISTAEAFRGLQRIGGQHHSVADVVARPIEEWRGLLVNDFEASLFPQHPQLADLKQRLYDLGAIYASMTGSGSAIYGIFAKDDLPPTDALRRDFAPISLHECRVL